jgi:hypothetical protein
MNNITDWIKYELYPILFQSMDTALPEFNFKKFRGGWMSSLKIDLSNPKQRRADKTVVSSKAPGLILEQGGDILSLVNYVIKRDGVEFIQAVKTLAEVVGLQLPKGDFNQESYQKYKDQATLLEDCNSYFIYCLQNSTGTADKALELINTKLKEVKLKDRATEYSSLIKTIKEEDIKERQANKPESLNSGYTAGGEPLILPSGSINIFKVPNSRGKTTFLINMA